MWGKFEVERVLLSNIRKVWSSKCKVIDFWSFHGWYVQSLKKCHYCDITEKEIELLLERNKIYTKRITTRGRRLEIDRKIANKEYDEIENLAFCCYWCNNAKTDEFTESEFLEIGQSFKSIWKSRLANN